jgi:hypothetical protein
MLALAGIGVAYHARPRVRAATRYALDYAGLDGALEWFSDEAQLLAVPASNALYVPKL